MYREMMQQVPSLFLSESSLDTPSLSSCSELHRALETIGVSTTSWIESSIEKNLTGSHRATVVFQRHIRTAIASQMLRQNRLS
jgi:hypothetical protein